MGNNRRGRGRAGSIPTPQGKVRPVISSRRGENRKALNGHHPTDARGAAAISLNPARSTHQPNPRRSVRGIVHFWRYTWRWRDAIKASAADVRFNDTPMGGQQASIIQGIFARGTQRRNTNPRAGVIRPPRAPHFIEVVQFSLIRPQAGKHPVDLLVFSLQQPLGA